LSKEKSGEEKSNANGIHDVQYWKKWGIAVRDFTQSEEKGHAMGGKG